MIVRSIVYDRLVFYRFRRRFRGLEERRDCGKSFQREKSKVLKKRKVRREKVTQMREDNN